MRACQFIAENQKWLYGSKIPKHGRQSSGRNQNKGTKQEGEKAMPSGHHYCRAYLSATAFFSGLLGSVKFQNHRSNKPLPNTRFLRFVCNKSVFITENVNIYIQVKKKICLEEISEYLVFATLMRLESTATISSIFDEDV